MDEADQALPLAQKHGAALPHAAVNMIATTVTVERIGKHDRREWNIRR